ncbi:hypothetical protein D3C75_609860 [compost metagenome]
MVAGDGFIQLGAQRLQPLMGPHVGGKQLLQLAAGFDQGDYLFEDLAIAHRRGVIGETGRQAVDLVDLVADKQEGALQILLITLRYHLLHQALQLVLLEGQILQRGELLDHLSQGLPLLLVRHHAGQVPLHLLQQGGYLLDQILVQPGAALSHLAQHLLMIQLLAQVAGVALDPLAELGEGLALAGGFPVVRTAGEGGLAHLPQGHRYLAGEPLVIPQSGGVPELGQLQQQAGAGPLQPVGIIDGRQTLLDDQPHLAAQPVPHHIGRAPHGQGQDKDGHEGEPEPPPQGAGPAQPPAPHGLAACSTSTMAAVRLSRVSWRHRCCRRSAWGLGLSCS